MKPSRRRSIPIPAKASQDRKPATTASPVASTPVRPKPVTPARSPRLVPVKAVASNPVRTKEPAHEVPAVAVLSAKPSAPVIAAPVVEVAAAAPAPAPRPEAVGPFFESNQVNEPPRMATRVEPRLPAELRDRSVKEVVVVRALVSQSGQPTRISLLRRSKTGPQLDDVVLAAVNQWTFSPAKKKGEPVSCWFNFAVPVASKALHAATTRSSHARQHAAAGLLALVESQMNTLKACSFTSHASASTVMKSTTRRIVRGAAPKHLRTLALGARARTAPAEQDHQFAGSGRLPRIDRARPHRNAADC